MKKKMYYLIPVSIFLTFLTFFVSTVTIYAKETTYNTKHLIEKSEKGKICLYYNKKTNGMLQGFYLKSGDNVKYFNWKSIDKEGFYPTVSLIQDDYIAVVCIQGEGSELDIQELHLINKNTLKEFSYKNPLDVVKANVTSDIQAPNVTIQIDNNAWSSTYPKVKNLSNFFEKAYYGNVITYDVKDTYFVATLPVQVTPALFIGNIEITYLWNKEEMNFIPYDINFNFENSQIE